MPHDPGTAQILRDDLADLPVTERRMFGALCFLLHGHMVCDTFQDGAMFRVGKPDHAQALTLPGVITMAMGGSQIAGFVQLSGEDVADERRRAPLLTLALAFVKSLPPK